MNRFLVFLLLIASCTDKGDSVNYIFKNISNKTFEVLMFNGLSIEFRSKLVINESTQLFTDKPPFEGPFSSIDSIKLIFEDEKKRDEIIHLFLFGFLYFQSLVYKFIK